MPTKSAIILASAIVIASAIFAGVSFFKYSLAAKQDAYVECEKFAKLNRMESRQQNDYVDCLKSKGIDANFKPAVTPPAHTYYNRSQPSLFEPEQLQKPALFKP